MEEVYNAYKNKNLLVPDVDGYEFQGRKYRRIVLNPRLDATLCAIDKYWPERSEIVTSGVRVPADSLRIIRNYLMERGLDKVYPEAMTCDILEMSPNEKGIYVWQKAWSALLNTGLIINPPYPAVCLMDYFRDGINKIGRTIGQSPHIRGTAFDLSGLDSLTIVKRLVEDKMISNFLIERANNCIHIDL
jgi:hypothetical protein